MIEQGRDRLCQLGDEQVPSDSGGRRAHGAWGEERASRSAAGSAPRVRRSAVPTTLGGTSAPGASAARSVSVSAGSSRVPSARTATTRTSREGSEARLTSRRRASGRWSRPRTSAARARAIAPRPREVRKAAARVPRSTRTPTSASLELPRTSLSVCSTYRSAAGHCASGSLRSWSTASTSSSSSSSAARTPRTAGRTRARSRSWRRVRSLRADRRTTIARRMRTHVTLVTTRIHTSTVQLRANPIIAARGAGSPARGRGARGG